MPLEEVNNGYETNTVRKIWTVYGFDRTSHAVQAKKRIAIPTDI